MKFIAHRGKTDYSNGRILRLAFVFTGFKMQSHARFRCPGWIKRFTLIELLVVIAIISLLVSILLPSLNKAKMVAKRVACLGNMKNTNSSLLIYADDNDGTLPMRRNCWSHVYSQVATTRYYCNLGLLVEGRYIPKSVIFCPALPNPWNIKEASDQQEWANYAYYYLQAPASYYYDTGNVSKRITLRNLWTTVLLTDYVLGRFGRVTGFYHGKEGMNAAFVDGSVQWVADRRLYSRILADMEDGDGDYGLNGTFDCWTYLEEAY
jgi:prepilin-type N-terminal cleavage/methylation domain-containing protein/prepilin-type processing-associated H-X9-DG protein